MTSDERTSLDETTVNRLLNTYRIDLKWIIDEIDDGFIDNVSSLVDRIRAVATKIERDSSSFDKLFGVLKTHEKYGRAHEEMKRIEEYLLANKAVDKKSAIPLPDGMFNERVVRWSLSHGDVYKTFKKRFFIDKKGVG